jgi:hypothetical protein
MKNAMTKMTRAPLGAVLCVLVAALALAGCGSGSDSTEESSTVTVNGDVPLAYVKRSNTIMMNPTNGAPGAAGGDLMIREKSSPSAPEHNITARFTLGQGDASDPEVSYDGKKIVFAMRCPTSNAATIEGLPACTGRWNIWEYDMTAGGMTGGTFRRLTASTQDDDVDPVYLPAGRGFVFSSNRQTKSKMNQALGQVYYGLDEYERERVFNLHSMDAQGAAIQQTTFNQSHDRNPVVRPNGDIMFARWEHVGDRNRFAIFRTKPDGTDMFVLYGAQSPGNSFLHPRDMDPAGPYKGQLATSLMSLSGTQEGGALMIVDAASYSEQNTAANSTIPAVGGQKQLSTQELSDDRELSPRGRATTPYPLWDGTNRVLVAWRACEVYREGVVVPCVSLTGTELTRLNTPGRTRAERDADPVQDTVPASYAIYMFDPARQTWLVVAAPPAGYMYTDPIALQARTEPNSTEPTNVDATLAAQNMALIEVRSVYDTDGLNRMAEQMLAAADLPAGCTTGIALHAPDEAMDTRALVADIAKIKDPADPAYRCAPAWFVRATRAVAPPAGMSGMRSAIGETEFEQQQILGYAPVEPDGSFKLKVPADVPLTFAIIDRKGRAYQTHTNWIQVRPGERRTCDGCHSPRRGAALNSGVVVNSLPAALKSALSSAHQSGETMASVRTRLDPTLLNLRTDLAYTDMWADTTQNGIVARPSVAIAYTGNASASDNLATAVPANGVINYPDHVQPLWIRNRGANTCVTCHADATKLDLRGITGGSGRLTSYDELLLGDPVIDGNGQPVIQLRDGVPVVQRGIALVENSSGAMNSAGIARKSRLTEIMFGETLLAGAASRTAHPSPPVGAPDHSTMLNAAEKRVLVEWMDLGGQYYNNPFDSNGVRSLPMLSMATFESQVLPVLRTNCIGCHQAGTTNAPPPPGVSFRGNRFVLTGDADGDFGVSLSMITDACTPGSNYLLQRPSTVPHPSGATGQATALLPVGSAGYTSIFNWISAACH